ncbi:hypothetical protein B0H34DRAFT_450510 [Crassisporium funariophilum]|nr:hypothetical protein B0H34DRAFT_450510 [Crassisporium funariophilum]
MPVATSSRRKPNVRRQNSSDIEDSRPTQADGAEDDAIDETRPQGSRARVKMEKKANGKQRAEPERDDEAAAEDDAEEDDDEDRIDVDNFPDHPLSRVDLVKINGISKDWESMQRQTWDKWDSIKDVAAAMAEAGEGGSNKESLDELDLIMREFLDVGSEMEAHSKTLDHIHQQIARGEEVNNVLECYTAGLQERLEEHAGKTMRQKYAKNPKYVDFRSSIWEVDHPNDPMPPLTEFIPREDGDDSDSDDDLEMGGATQNFNCPLTLTPLVNPVTSRVCHHSFSADAIKEYCRPPGQPRKCPAAGCNKSFTLTDCQPDDALAKKVKAHQRRAAAAAEDSDAEEVID